MLAIQENISLKPYNTFGFDVNTRYFIEIRGLDELKEFREMNQAENLPYLLLGGGSNILCTGDFKGIVLRISNKGIRLIEETHDEVLVEVSSGENWHEFVLWSIEQGFGGLENLSLIPGNVGSSPIQNIGAYGAEVEKCIDKVTFFSLESGEMVHMSREDCKFGYRDSIFKHELKGKAIIWKITFRLSRHPILNTSYGAIGRELESMGVKEPTIKDVSNAVIHIRSSKLPDPQVLGNAGSFFKNPTIENENAKALQKDFPAIPVYHLPGGKVKIAAGWMVEQCGWKGYRHGDAGIHQQQALVLVNYGSATGLEILSLARQIQQSVMQKFGILLETEVNVC